MDATFGQFDGDGSTPDYVRAMGVDGKKGWIKSSDLRETEPSNPKEAVKMMKARDGKTRFIPVYARDGVTKIDRFPVG